MRAAIDTRGLAEATRSGTSELETDGDMTKLTIDKATDDTAAVQGVSRR
ncbi:MAG: hypothetical protein ACJAR2_001372 [Ilumatobacter sp.]|jgi:hypothetical protein